MTSTPASDASTSAAPGRHGRRIVVRRTIPATVDELFDAWLDPHSLAQWMHPGTDTPSTATVDPRVGGTFEVVMHHTDGTRRHRGEYRVIERNARLVFSWVSDATHHAETLVTVDFNILGAGTEIVITHERMPDHAAGVAHTHGWTAALELLDRLLRH